MEAREVEPDKLKQIVEAALLAADEPISVDQLVKLFKPSEIDKDTIRADTREALKVLTEEAEGRGYELVRVASGYRYQVRQELSPWISRLWEEKPPRYTRALLETLALVAYKQPVTRGDIEQVRGVSVSQNIMRTLLERGWIRVVGQREVPGRPSMYGTTREFLDYFNLKSLDQLPPLAEIRELIEPVIAEETADETADEQLAENSGSIDVTEPGEADAEAGDATVEPEAAEFIESGGLAALEDDDEEDVDLDSADFDAEIAAAIAAADEASDRFNNPDAGQETEEVDDNPGRPQVVDVVTDLDTPDEAAAADAQEAEQPTAEVVQLPRAPH
jgi:segregation and condensation protein B